MRRHFKTRGEAVAWRAEMGEAVRKGTVSTSPGSDRNVTVQEAAAKLVQGMRDGSVLDNRQGQFKPSTVRGYERTLTKRLPVWFARRRVRDVTRQDVLELTGEWRGEGLQPSTVQNRADALRVLFRQAVDDELIAVVPTVRLKLEAPSGRRERVATADEARGLVGALPERERALWATAFYCGLRCGELRALRWSDVDDAAGRLHVRASWDEKEGRVEPKTKAGTRKVPLGAAGPFLAAHWALNPTAGPDDLVFGRTARAAFVKTTANARAKRAWARADLPAITMHECRHSCITWWALSGTPLHVVSRMAGHASIQVTADRYGHLLPDSLDDAAAAVEAFLAR